MFNSGVVRFAWMTSVVSLAMMAQAQKAATLKVGDTAPKMDVAKWVKGAPVNSFQKGKVYVVEFWATWCGPCKKSIPHLTKMQKKFGANVTFTGISVYEGQDLKDNKHLDKVASFVKDMGKTMDYTVGADAKEGVMAKSWMEAAGQGGIPTAFIVNKEGKIAWIGHPMVGLGSVLQKVVADKYDVAQVAKDNAALPAIMKELGEGDQDPEPKDAVVKFTKIIKDHPTLEPLLGMAKFQALCHSDEKEAMKYAGYLAENVYNDDPEKLNNIAWDIMDEQNGIYHPDYKMAQKIAKMALDMIEDDDLLRSMTTDTLALALFRNGEIDKAIIEQEKAIKLAEASKQVDEDTMKDMKARLEQFKKKKN